MSSEPEGSSDCLITLCPSCALLHLFLFFSINKISFSHDAHIYLWTTTERSDSKRAGDESHAVVVFSSVVVCPELQSQLTLAGAV